MGLDELITNPLNIPFLLICILLTVLIIIPLVTMFILETFVLGLLCIIVFLNNIYTNTQLVKEKIRKIYDLEKP